MKEFQIPVYGLKTGKHEYDFNIDQSFFDAFESNLLEEPNIRVDLELEKMSNMLILNFKAKGQAKSACDRCGEPLEIPISSEERVIVKYGTGDFEETDEIMIIPPDEHEIDVSHRIYEMLILNLPSRNIHKSPADCDPEVIQRLENFEEEKGDTTDPRWDALKKLK